MIRRALGTCGGESRESRAQELQFLQSQLAASDFWHSAPRDLE